MRRKSGEEIVAEMKIAEEEKREFYVNIARWVDSVSTFRLQSFPKSISVLVLTLGIVN